MSFRNNSFGKTVLVNRIAIIRRERHMTQTDLAKAVGLSKASISKLENANNGTTAFTAAMLCRALGCKFEDLFTLL